MDAVCEDNNAFLLNIVRNIPGWLLDYTALATMEILTFQEQSEISGSLIEIGVFAGRYFSILFRSALKSDSKIVGIDTFQHVDQDRVLSFLNSVSAEYGKLFLIKGPSSEWNARDLIAELGEPARFISIDGSHDKSDVFWDLRLAEAVISKEGVVAVDDFLNPNALGVNEAVNEFFRQPRNLVPWAYLPNKLFLARPAWAYRYKTFLEEAVLRDEISAESYRFRENLQKGRHHVEVTLFSKEILIIV
jgi:predicted O-methyltransferase YrrM